MHCLALTDSGNYTMNLSRILQNKGYMFDVIATPSKLSRGNCGYSLKFQEEYLDDVINAGRMNNIPVKEIYRVKSYDNKTTYEKIY